MAEGALPAQARPDVVCLSSIDWGDVWQGHQHIMAALARRGHRVLFVENTGVRRPGLRDLPRLRRRLRGWRGGPGGLRPEGEGLTVCAPLVLPWPYSAAARRLNRRLVLRALRPWLASPAATRPVVWAFLPTPLSRDLVRSLDPALTVYYCVDDLRASSPAARRVAASEAWFLETADLVFATSRHLERRAARLRARVHRFPFGVDLARFDAAGPAGGPPPDLARLPRPVVGYVGGLHAWLDQDLLVEVAGRLPGASIALVGPVRTDVSRLAGCPNVHLLGPRPHDALPGYVRGFDAAVIPYRRAEYTASVYPTKLNEYLALGIPVVATALPELVAFRAEHGEVIALADGADAFAAALRAATASDSPAARARRVAAARANGWEARLDAMWALVDAALAARGPESARTGPPR